MVARARITEQDVDSIIDEWIDEDFTEESLDEHEARIFEWEGLRKNEGAYAQYMKQALEYLGFEIGSFIGVNHAWRIMNPILDALYDEGVAIPGAVELVDPAALPRDITLAHVERAAELVYTAPEWEADFVTAAGRYIATHTARMDWQESIVREWERLQAFPPALRDKQWNRWAAFTYALEYFEELRFATS